MKFLRKKNDQIESPERKRHTFGEPFEYVDIQWVQCQDCGETISVATMENSYCE